VEKGTQVITWMLGRYIIAQQDIAGRKQEAMLCICNAGSLTGEGRYQELN